MRKKEKTREIPSRSSRAIKVWILVAALLVINVFTGLVHVLPSQARREVEWEYGIQKPQTIWQHWEWELPLSQKQSYLSVNDRQFCFSNVGLHWLGSFVRHGWYAEDPMILSQQAGHPAQCGMYLLQDGKDYIMYLVGRIADYRIDQVVFTLRWGFDEETIELAQKDWIRTEHGIFFVHRMNISGRKPKQKNETPLSKPREWDGPTGIWMTVLDEEGQPMIWKDSQGYESTSYYIKERMTAGR